MTAHDKSAKEVLTLLRSDENSGLSAADAVKNAAAYGSNRLTEKKKKGVFYKIIKALFEPMMIILLFALAITAGINIGKFFKDGSKSAFIIL